MDIKGGRPRWSGDGGLLNWAIGIDMYTLMYIKLMTDLKKKIIEFEAMTIEIIQIEA